MSERATIQDFLVPIKTVEKLLRQARKIGSDCVRFGVVVPAGSEVYPDPVPAAEPVRVEGVVWTVTGGVARVDITNCGSLAFDAWEGARKGQRVEIVIRPITAPTPPAPAAGKE